MRSLLRLVVLSIAAAPFSAHAGASGQWRLAVEAPISHRATVIAFLDERNGITAGYAGAMFVTHDGGKSWTPAVNQSACRFGLEALPGGFAWTAGNQGNVRFSKDGGEHWTVVGSFGRTEPGHARYLSFVDAKRGAIASPDDVALTTDGGETWTKAPLPAKAGVIAAVSLSEEAGALRLRLLDDRGDLWASADAGATWTKAASPITKPVFESMTGPRAAMRFTPAGEGVLVAILDEGEPRGRVYRTRDGGKTWKEEAVASGLKPSVLTISHDGKLVTSFDQYVVRVYAAE